VKIIQSFQNGSFHSFLADVQTKASNAELRGEVEVIFAHTICKHK